MNVDKIFKEAEVALEATLKGMVMNNLKESLQMQVNASQENINRRVGELIDALQNQLNQNNINSIVLQCAVQTLVVLASDQSANDATKNIIGGMN